MHKFSGGAEKGPSVSIQHSLADDDCAEEVCSVFGVEACALELSLYPPTVRAGLSENTDAQSLAQRIFRHSALLAGGGGRWRSVGRLRCADRPTLGATN